MVTVIVLGHNRRGYLLDLLAALYRQTYKDVEIIVVDNASEDGSAQAVESQFPMIHLIVNRRNYGMVAYNQGFEVARGEYILVVDDDGLPASDDWIGEVVKRFENDPSLGVVSCTIRMRDTGKIANDSPQFDSTIDDILGYPGVAYNGTGAGIRTKALKQVGYYPSHFFTTYLELYLCTRLLDAGWHVRHFPNLEVWHCRSTGTSDPPLTYYGLRNYMWYVWSTYPWPAWLQETAHEVGSRIQLALLGKVPFRRLFKAWYDSIRDMREAVTTRRPINRKTLKELQRLRNYGNWHGIAPEIIPFDASD